MERPWQESSSAPLSLTEWAVLGFVAQRPTHGFQLARAFQPGGEVGWIWTVSRPLVYRALERLAAMGFLAAKGQEPGRRGPKRTVWEATPAGRAAVDGWLEKPVARVRDVRAGLLLKLWFLERAGRDPRPLLLAQRRALRPVLQRLERRLGSGQGAAQAAALFRLEMARSVLRTLDALLADRPTPEAEPTEGPT